MRLRYLLIIFVFHISCSEKQEDATVVENFKSILLNEQRTYTAGEIAALKFEIKGEADIRLMLSNVFGSSTVLPEIDTEGLLFTIPKNYMRKSGPCHWVLLANGKSVNKGSFKIKPKTKSKATLETYFGPRSISAGFQDFSMLISITTDPFDNVFPTGTEVLFKSQFLSACNTFKNTLTAVAVNLSSLSIKFLVQGLYITLYSPLIWRSCTPPLIARVLYAQTFILVN